MGGMDLLMVLIMVLLLFMIIVSILILITLMAIEKGPHKQSLIVKCLMALSKL